MKSIKKTLFYGFLIWLIPFITAFLIFPIKESNRALFESIMPIAITVSVVFFAYLYFKKLDNDYKKEGIMNNNTKFIFWTPRILSIMFIVFLSLTSLDVFSSESTPWQIAVGLFMHNIPVLVLLAVLIISWKREIVGGIAFILAGLLCALLVLSTAITTGFEWYLEWYYVAWIAQISGIAFLIGILFLIGWRKKQKKH